MEGLGAARVRRARFASPALALGLAGWALAGWALAGCEDPDPIEPDGGAEPGVDAGAAADAGEVGEDVDGGAPPTPDAGDPTVGMFVAMGHNGRTTVSCDDGRSWVADRSDDDTLRCDAEGVDCDHNGGRGMGVTFGDGWFVATWGWGRGNGVRRSQDGVSWEAVTEDTAFSGVEFLDGRFAAISGRPLRSLDHGASWEEVGRIGFMGHIRATGVLPGSGGVFVAAGSENRSEVGEVMRSADGLTWERPQTMPEACGAGVRAVGAGDGVLVMTHRSDLVCRSADGGRTWTDHALGGEASGPVVWTGERFVTYGAQERDRVRFTSADGQSWTAEPTTLVEADGEALGEPRLGAVARSPAGTWVGVLGGWRQWYERQVFYRSEDGLRWEALDAGAFTGSHPIRAITYGRGLRSEACP